MKRIKAIAFVSFFAFSFCTPKKECSLDNIKEIMGVWYKKPVQIPAAIKLINKDTSGVTTDTGFSVKRSKFTIIHFFTADCDQCVNELLVAQQFINSHKDICNLSYVFIASGPSDYYAADAIRKSGFRFPVYYERQYFSFKNLNHFPLDDKMYNTVLVNDKGEMVLFGGFFNNEKATELLKQVTSCEPCS